MFQSRYGMIHFFLHIFRQRTGHSTNIHLICIETFRLNKYLMTILICKTDYFIFNWRAITRTGSFDHTGIQWRTIKVCTNDLMSFLICICQPAGFLLYLNIFRISWEWKWYNSLISKLFLHFTVINCISGNTGRCSCFKTEHFNSQLFQRISQVVGCLQSVWSCIITYITVNTSCF